MMRKEGAKVGLQDPHCYKAFKYRVQSMFDALKDFLAYATDRNLKVAALGASTKGNVILQIMDSFFGDFSPVGRLGGRVHNFIDKIGDVNPDKHGHVTPGTFIPIVSEDEVLASNPDFLLVLPWHFRNHFVNNSKFKGRRLVFPLPQLEIVQL